MEILYAVIGIIVSYYIIYFAVKDAIGKKLDTFQNKQVFLLKQIALKHGMTEEDYDRLNLTDKQFKKKYERQVGEMLK